VVKFWGPPIDHFLIRQVPLSAAKCRRVLTWKKKIPVFWPPRKKNTKFSFFHEIFENFGLRALFSPSAPKNALKPIFHEISWFRPIFWVGRASIHDFLWVPMMPGLGPISVQWMQALAIECKKTLIWHSLSDHSWDKALIECEVCHSMWHATSTYDGQHTIHYSLSDIQRKH
jgi:hypothetical protein